MISNEIFAAIDTINTEVENSSFCVLESMVALYSKEIDFMDFCTNELKDEYIMEGSVLDNVKKSSKKDSNKLITFLLFIPRLIKEMCKAIGKAFSDSSLGKKLKEASDKFERHANATEKEAKVKEINEKEGKEVVYFDKKSGKIKFKRSWKDALSAVAWLGGVGDLMYHLFTNISNEFDVTNPTKIRKFVDECDKILHKRKEHRLPEVIDMGLGALGDLIGHISGFSGGLTAAGFAASSLVDTKLKELRLNGETEDNHQVLVAVKELSNKLMIINAAILAGTKLLDVAKKIVGYINIPIARVDRNRELDERAIAKIYKMITDKNPKILENHPRKDGLSDRDYQTEIIQQYFGAITKKKLPKDTPASEIRDASNEAILSTFGNIRDEITESDMRAYEAAVQKYYDEKKKLHEENPTIVDKVISKVKGKKSPDEKEENDKEE